VPNKHRAAVVGAFDAGSVISQIMPLVAWVMIKNTGTWRNMYYIMIGFQALTVFALFFFYHPPNFNTKHAGDGKSRLQLVKEFDWVGLILFTVGCASFIVGVNWGGSKFPWKSAPALIPIIFGFFILVAMGVWETQSFVKNPILPPRLFRQIRQ
jgi:hypothetical protein